MLRLPRWKLLPPNCRNALGGSVQPLIDYVRVCSDLPDRPVPTMRHACFTIGGQSRPWSEQNDGPALQTLAILKHSTSSTHRPKSLREASSSRTSIFSQASIRIRPPICGRSTRVYHSSRDRYNCAVSKRSRSGAVACSALCIWGPETVAASFMRTPFVLTQTSGFSKLAARGLS
jgi:hypothetical protein